MSPYDFSLLQAIPEPALFTRSNRVVAFNPAAGQLFDGIAQQSPVPECLLCEPPAAAMVLAGGQRWHMSASSLEDGTLYLLHIARQEAISIPQLDGVMRCLRQQVAQLLLSTQMLGREPDSRDTADRLAGMNRTLCRMLRMTEQLDLLRSLEADTFSYLPVTLDLAGLCREVCLAADGLLAEAELHLDFESPLSSLLVSGDSALLEKLLLELISNAARAAAEGGTLTLSLARRNGRALLTLSGPGGGKDGRSLVQLLAGDPPTDRIPQPGEGAGLGLALAQQVVTLHGGTLMMEQRDGVHVTVALPLCPSNAPLSVRTPRADYYGGFAPALVELSDLLPDSAFAHLDVE
ncbi:MAG: HAMP domain-containing histidine kinase [Oscillospiraceae bacterium]|nr:HAMP domain-containing histidine kinase [Oscillospiraceae bacterium]